MYNQK